MSLSNPSRRGAVMSIETLVKLGVVAVAIGILFGIFNSVRDAGKRFETEINKAPWKKD